MKQRYIVMSLAGVMNDREALLDNVYIQNEKVKMLKDICNEVNARVCILGRNTREKSESAKFFYDRMFKHLGLNIGIDTFFKDTNDFLSWLMKNQDIDYVILSSANDFKKSVERQVIFTNSVNGLQDTDITRIRDYFNPRW